MASPGNRVAARRHFLKLRKIPRLATSSCAPECGSGTLQVDQRAVHWQPLQEVEGHSISAINICSIDLPDYNDDESVLFYSSSSGCNLYCCY